MMLISACIGSTPGLLSWFLVLLLLLCVFGCCGCCFVVLSALGLCGTSRAVRRNIVDAAPATVAGFGGGAFAAAGGGFGGSGRSSTGSTRVIAGSIAGGTRGCSPVMCGRGGAGGGG